MYKRSPRFARRKGLSEMVGAMFILLLLVVAFGFSLVMFTSFTGYQNAVITRASFNNQAQSQQLTYNKAIFGATATNPANNSGSFLNVGVPGAAPANFYPLANMNFTTSASGWTFTRRYIQTGVTGISGNYDPVTSTGSPSGPGSVYSLFTTNPPNGSPETAVMNWTAPFTIDSATYNSLQNSGSTACFSWGSDITDAFSVGNNPSPFPNTSPTIDFMIVNPSLAGPSSYVIIQQRVTSSTDTNWSVSRGLCLTYAQQTQIFTNNQMTYNLVIYSVATLKNSGTGPPSWKAYFDDVGIQLSLYDFYSSTVCPVIAVSQAPLEIQDMTFAITSSYTSSVTQYIYAWDFAQGSLVQLDVTTTGTSSVTRYIDLAGLEGGASQTQSFIQSSTNAVVSPPGCPNDPIYTVPTTSDPNQYSIILKIYAVGTGAYTGTITGDVNTDYYTNSTQFSLQLTNDATAPLHLVSLWVIGPSGATQYASTYPSTGTPDLHFDEWVPPGQTVSITVPYNWTPGEYTIELVSDKGVVFTESISAS